MLKKIRNKRRTGNKVSSRYKYVKDKADWIYENTLERFDFAVKRRFKDKQDTTHFVFSFSRILGSEEKKKARQLISDFFFSKFGTEYYLSIAEHNDNQKTHYHILLSRNIETSKMLRLSNKEYMKLVRELNDVMSELMNEHELEIKEKYGTSQEYQMQLEAWQYHDYEKAIKRFLNKDFDVSDIKSFKALAKAAAEFVFEMLEKKDLDTVREFEEQTKIKFYLEKAKKRERLYMQIAENKVRVDKLSKKVKDKITSYLKLKNAAANIFENKEAATEKEVFETLKETVEALKEKKKQEQELKQKQNEDVFSVVREMIEEHKKKEKEQEEEFENRKRFRGPGM